MDRKCHRGGCLRYRHCHKLRSLLWPRARSSGTFDALNKMDQQQSKQILRFIKLLNYYRPKCWISVEMNANKCEKSAYRIRGMCCWTEEQTWALDLHWICIGFLNPIFTRPFPDIVCWFFTIIYHYRHWYEIQHPTNDLICPCPWNLLNFLLINLQSIGINSTIDFI